MRSARFHRWVLVAPPHFVGLIERELTPELRKHLLGTVEKDMSHLSSRELAEELRATVRIPVNEQDAVREPVKHPH
jgi:protein required for attachment to host cells